MVTVGFFLVVTVVLFVCFLVVTGFCLCVCVCVCSVVTVTDACCCGARGRTAETAFSVL